MVDQVRTLEYGAEIGLGWDYGNLLDLGIWNFGLDMETMCKNEDVECGADNPELDNSREGSHLLSH